MIFHAVSLLGERGISLAEAGLALSLLGMANAVGTIAAGAVSDRTRTRRLLSVMSALLLASLLVLLAPTAAAAYLAALVLLAAYAGAALLATARWRDPRAVRVRHNAR